MGAPEGGGRKLGWGRVVVFCFSSVGVCTYIHQGKKIYKHIFMYSYKLIYMFRVMGNPKS